MRKNERGIYHAIFILNKPDTTMLGQLTDFSMNKYDLRCYREGIKQLQENEVSFLPIEKIPFAKEWCPIYKYDERFVAYAPSDWGNHEKIALTDSTLVFSRMDCLYPYAIQKIETESPKRYRIELKGPYSGEQVQCYIHVVDPAQEIIVFETRYSEEQSDFKLMASAAKLKHFPILVNYCTEQKQMEVHFNEPDFRALIGEK
ncbi:MAG: hypothetical protein EP338_14400 [Bacteroidetes bacterium]|nr:MAG: hypothetical protein EP338_14400 [Bacteroidota bacterium]